MGPISIRYRNIQGLRAIAALMVFCCHLFWDIAPMRKHWAMPYVTAIGVSGVDIFFVISGFIIYHAAKRSAAQVDIVGRAQATYEFAVRRIIRIFPLYWIVFAAAAIITIWAPLPASILRKLQLELLLLTGSGSHASGYSGSYSSQRSHQGINGWQRARHSDRT